MPLRLRLSSRFSLPIFLRSPHFTSRRITVESSEFGHGSRAGARGCIMARTFQHYRFAGCSSGFGKGVASTGSVRQIVNRVSLLCPQSDVRIHCRAGPLVRGRPPGWPLGDCMGLIWLSEGGSRGTRADQGVRRGSALQPLAQFPVRAKDARHRVIDRAPRTRFTRLFPNPVKHPALPLLQFRAAICDSIKPNFSSLEGM
jgi:hypothetical protein